MARNKNARQVHYYIKREKIYNKQPTRYWMYIEGKQSAYLIEKKTGGWYSQGCYHQTLRDAIIYCLYGV